MLDEPDTSTGGSLCLILHFAFPSGEFHGTPEERELVAAAESRMDSLLSEAELGDVDGNEIGGGKAVLYVYGQDSQRVWEMLEPVARALPLRPAFALLEEQADGQRRQVQL